MLRSGLGSQFKARKSLRYLHIFETTVTLGPPTTSDDLGLRFHPLSAEELPRSLELFGYGVYLRPIVWEPLPTPGSGSGSIQRVDETRQTFGPCWSWEKVTFRTEEDFGCADWEWLLRWHDYDGLGASDGFRSSFFMVFWRGASRTYADAES